MKSSRLMGVCVVSGLVWTVGVEAQTPILTTHTRSSGTSCVQYGTPAGSSSAYPQHGWLMNDNASAKEYRCPTPIINNANTYPDAHISVWVYDRSTTDGVTCQLRLYSGNSTSATSIDFDSAATSNLDQNAHELQMSINQGIYGAPYSRFYLTCEIPGLNGSGDKSGILAYEFDTDAQ